MTEAPATANDPGAKVSAPRTPGPLTHSGGTTFTLHTRAAQRIVTDRTEGLSLFQAANAIDPIYQLTATENVVADTCLLEIDRQLHVLDDHFEVQVTGLDRLFAQRQTAGLVHGDTASVSPRSWEHADFRSPYGYALLALVAKYDGVTRRLLGAERFALIPRAEVLERINTPRRLFLELFRVIGQFSHTVDKEAVRRMSRPMPLGASGDKGIEQRLAAARACCEAIGLSLRDDVVIGELRPDFHLSTVRSTESQPKE